MLIVCILVYGDRVSFNRENQNSARPESFVPVTYRSMRLGIRN